VRRLCLLLGLLVTLAAGSHGALVASESLETLHSEDLINPFLGPAWTRWLVGPLGQLADEDERTLFLLIESDEEAAAFVEEFWNRRDAALLRQYEQRAAEADKRYSESGALGRRTDRGMVYILFGDPEKTEWEEHRDIDDPDIELWTYPRDAAKGLNGKKPSRRYRFARDSDVMRLFSNDPRDPENRRRRMMRRIREPRRPWPQ